jgi:tetratricopeptide (TPR) repeat protein
MAQKRYEEAVALFQKRYDAAPHAENLFALAEALDHAGHKDEAARAFADFERIALKESEIADNANHELVLYYADYAHQPQKAREIAQKELGRRHDAFTLDVYAWALAASGEREEAAAKMQEAIAFGVQDPRVLEHARAIAGR